MKFIDNLEWYVMINNFNDSKIDYYNIFDNEYLYSTKTGISKLLKEYTCFEDFKEDLNSVFKYCFLGKMGYELYISGTGENDKRHKLDVYFQIKPNLDLIARYIITEYNKNKRKKLIIDRRSKNGK